MLEQNWFSMMAASQWLNLGRRRRSCETGQKGGYCVGWFDKDSTISECVCAGLGD